MNTEQEITNLKAENAELKKRDDERATKQAELEARILKLERVHEQAALRGIGADALGL